MAYRLENPAHIGASVTEEFLDRIDRASCRFHHLAVSEAVHTVRKDCKKGRGIVRMVRPEMEDEYEVVNALLRDAARLLAPIRDPQAMVGTFDALVAASSETLPDDGLPRVRARLVADAKAATEAIRGPESHRVDDAMDLIEAAGTRARSWELSESPDILAGGIRKTYKRARNRLSDALESPTDEAFHEWRKRVKYHWYHTRLIGDAAPSVLDPRASALHDLSDALGDAHDLAILADSSRAMEVPDGEREAFATLAIGWKGELERRAIGLGTRLFIEEPDAITERYVSYAEAWQEGPEPVAGEIGALFPADDDLADRSHRELYTIARQIDLAGRSTMDRGELESALRAVGW